MTKKLSKVLNFEILYLDRKIAKYFEICIRPVYYIYKLGVKISNLSDNHVECYD